MNKGKWILAAVAFAFVPLVHGQTGDWPSKPIKIIVASAAGGAADFLARSLVRAVFHPAG